MRDLEPSVQAFVAKAFLSSKDGPGLFCLCAFYLNGYGVEQNVEKGLKVLSQAAATGHPLAQGYMYRLHISCGAALPSGSLVTEYLERQAINGSRLALQDMKIVDPSKGHHIRELVKYGYGGVGTSWYNDNQMLHELTQPKLMDKDFSLDALSSEADITDLKANLRGDHLIHAAAAFGSERRIRELLTDKHININQLNSKGETALLCACRSGHPDVVKFLLDNGAKASISATNGETPLHWLLSFDDKINIAALGTDLIQKGGATVDAFTTERIAYSCFPGSIDVDFQAEGTPLMWAVHHNSPRIVRFLLANGADPKWQYLGSGLTPVDWAAFYHHSECLRIMINHLETLPGSINTTSGKPDPRFAALYGPLVRQALHAADKFSMILRNGPSYLTELHATLNFLKSKTPLINFQVASHGETLLHLAASEAHDEAVQWLLENQWRIQDINKPAGVAGRTPLLESVRWNRKNLFHLLVAHGADVKSLAPNPYSETNINWSVLDPSDHSRLNWSALHIFANEAHNEDLSLVDDIINQGVAVDGPDLEIQIETPFNVAVRKNAFRLADLLLSRGADINASSTNSSLVVSPFPLTGLGHIVALNARYSSSALQYMLSHQNANKENMVGFIAEKSRKLSVLHLAALVPDGLKAVAGQELLRKDFDMESNRAIVHELLEWFKTPEHLNMKSAIGGKTALHLAVERGNIGVVEELVKAGADISIVADSGETSLEMGKKLFDGLPVLEEMSKFLA